MAQRNSELYYTAGDVRDMITIVTNDDPYYTRYRVYKTVHNEGSSERLFYMMDEQTGKRYTIKVVDNERKEACQKQ